MRASALWRTRRSAAAEERPPTPSSSPSATSCCTDASSPDSDSSTSSDTGTGRSASNSSIEQEQNQSNADQTVSQEELQKLRRRARTSAARAALMVKRANSKLQASVPGGEVEQHRAAGYRKDMQPDSSIHLPGTHDSDGRKDRPRRLRLLVSYVQAWCAAITRFFQRDDIRIHHVLTCSITDDTNMKLATVPAGSTHWRLSRVVTVMNSTQQLVARFSRCDSDSDFKSFTVPTPQVSLQRASAACLTTEYTSRLLLFLGRVSQRFRISGITADLERVPIQALVLSFDSLVTNMAMLKRMRAAQHEKRVELQVKGVIAPILAICCGIHQLALTRKSLVLRFGGVWTSIVRLGHLFEAHSFRRQFQAALLQVVVSSYSYVACSSLPRSAKQWRLQRLRKCNLLTDDPAYSSKRRQLHMCLSQFDNCDSESVQIIHYCTGQCCVGSSKEAKSEYALLQLCKLYSLLFAHGYPVPLLYRWVHASRALQFCKEAWLDLAQSTDANCRVQSSKVFSVGSVATGCFRVSAARSNKAMSRLQLGCELSSNSNRARPSGTRCRTHGVGFG